MAANVESKYYTRLPSYPKNLCKRISFFFWQLIKPTKLRGKLKEGNLTLRGVRERVKDSEKKIRMSVKGKFIVYVPKDVACRIIKICSSPASSECIKKIHKFHLKSSNFAMPNEIIIYQKKIVSYWFFFLRNNISIKFQYL